MNNKSYIYYVYSKLSYNNENAIGQKILTELTDRYIYFVLTDNFNDVRDEMFSLLKDLDDILK